MNWIENPRAGPIKLTTIHTRNDTGGGRAGKFLALSLGVTAALLLLGYPPTLKLAGPGGVSGMFAGCGISLAASWIGAIPLVALGRPAVSGRDVAITVMFSSVVRFLIAIALTLSMALSGWFDRATLLIWVAISYVILLVVDTGYVLKASRSTEKSGK